VRTRYSDVVSTLALFAALGGVSYAAITIPKNSVGTKQLRAGAVTSKKVKDGTLLAKDLAPGQFLNGATGAPGLAGAPGTDGADGQDGQIGPVGPAGTPGKDFEYASVSVVKDEGTPAQNGQALAAAVDAIPRGAGAPDHLVFVEPGEYALTATLQLAHNIVLDGSGLDVTLISAVGISPVVSSPRRLRDLTVFLETPPPTAVAVYALPGGKTYLQDVRIVMGAGGPTSASRIGVDAPWSIDMRGSDIELFGPATTAIGVRTSEHPQSTIRDSSIVAANGGQADAVGLLLGSAALVSDTSISANANATAAGVRTAAGISIVKDSALRGATLAGGTPLAVDEPGGRLTVVDSQLTGGAAANGPTCVDSYDLDYIVAAAADCTFPP
jgi:hypothetical protein